MTSSIASHASPTVSSGSAPITSSAPTPTSETLSQADALIARARSGHLDLQNLGADSKSTSDSELLTLVKHMPASAWLALEKASGAPITSIALPEALRDDPKTGDVLKSLASLTGLKSVSIPLQAGGHIDLSDAPPQWTRIDLRVNEDRQVSFKAPSATHVAVMHGTRQINLDGGTPAPHMSGTDVLQAEDIRQKIASYAETKASSSAPTERTTPSPTPRSSISSGIATPSGTPRSSVSTASTSRISSTGPTSVKGMEPWSQLEALKAEKSVYDQVVRNVKNEFVTENLDYLNAAPDFLASNSKEDFDALVDQYVAPPPSASSDEKGFLGSGEAAEINISDLLRTKLQELRKLHTFDDASLAEARQAAQEAAKEVWGMLNMGVVQRTRNKMDQLAPPAAAPVRVASAPARRSGMAAFASAAFATFKKWLTPTPAVPQLAEPVWRAFAQLRGNGPLYGRVAEKAKQGYAEEVMGSLELAYRATVTGSPADVRRMQDYFDNQGVNLADRLKTSIEQLSRKPDFDEADRANARDLATEAGREFWKMLADNVRNGTNGIKLPNLSEYSR